MGVPTILGTLVYHRIVGLALHDAPKTQVCGSTTECLRGTGATGHIFEVERFSAE